MLRMSLIGEMLQYPVILSPFLWVLTKTLNLFVTCSGEINKQTGQGDKGKTHLVEFTSNVVSRFANVQRRHILVRLSAGGDDQVGGDWNDEEAVAQLVRAVEDEAGGRERQVQGGEAR